MKVRVEQPRNLKAGDRVFNDYGRDKVYLSKVEKVIDNGKAIIVGQGGHAHRVEFTNILAQAVGSNVKAAVAKMAFITFKDRIAEALAKGGNAILVETFTEWYNRTYNKEQ